MTTDHVGPQPTAPATCDRCIARAAFLVRIAGGGELVFCGHHLRVHHERLRASGAVVRPLLTRSVMYVRGDAA
ncbi:DUF7455 domain-containing protein [Actinomycetospora cinnamomea]|uniref:DUF7455 domain-containing protein n=1 Tax=Actinomycetospora cinnamomea TaxID=663609 RepID=A0A2U1F7K3_9PSEU|nr:hypothetical protein [Actinomycetospora cinnamomea]PVZ08161.1 hypothetical protein C8D89_10944 [Actinomycetospora cinnamomea]